MSVRNLIYYVYPVRGNGVWQRNVAALKKRADLFNGNRVVAVAEQKGTVYPRPEGAQRPPHTVDPWEMVRDELGGDFACLPVANNAALGEVPAFRDLLQHGVTGFGPDEYTFYAHAKGVTRPFGPGVSVHPWTAILYAANLDYWTKIKAAFEKHTLAGAIKLRTPVTMKRVCVREGGTIKYRRVVQQSRWHYSGTFFWIKNASLLGTPYLEVDNVWGGVEFWPGKHFPEPSGYSIFDSRPGTMYDWKTTGPTMRDFTSWSNANELFRRGDASPEPWLEYCGYSWPCQ